MPANRITTTLHLYLPATWPAQTAAASWAVFNDQGTCLQQGHSEPRHWPAASRTEVILTGEQCLLTRLNLPRTTRARTPEALTYALEEQLLGEAAEEHVVLGGALNDAWTHDAAARPAVNSELTAVWLIRQSRLRGLLQALQALNIQPQRLYSELQLLPLPADGGWTLYLKPASEASLLRTGDEQGGSLDRPLAADTPLEEPPLELQLALDQARAETSACNPPPSIDVWSSAGQAPIETSLPHWQSRLAIKLNYRGEFRWQDQLRTQARRKSGARQGLPRNLLTAEFSPASAPGQGWSNLRPALNLAALILTLYTLFSLGHWGWLHHEQQEIRQQMQRIFRAAQPQAQAVVDPVLQMQRLHDQARREHGQLTASDFLPLLERTSAQFPAQTRLQQLNYEDGRLEIQLQLTSLETLGRLQRRLEQAGLQVVIRDQRPVAADSSLLVTLAVRSRP